MSHMCHVAYGPRGAGTAPTHAGAEHRAEGGPKSTLPALVGRRRRAWRASPPGRREPRGVSVSLVSPNSQPRRLVLVEGKAVGEGLSVHLQGKEEVARAKTWCHKQRSGGGPPWRFPTMTCSSACRSYWPRRSFRHRHRAQLCLFCIEL